MILRAVLAIALMTMAPAAFPADIGPGGQDPYSPVPPVGFAADFPRSPLEDVFVNGYQRFLTPAAAQTHCPHDVVVAVPFLVPRDQPPGQGGLALYMCRTDAAAEGNRPAAGP